MDEILLMLPGQQQYPRVLNAMSIVVNHRAK